MCPAGRAATPRPYAANSRLGECIDIGATMPLCIDIGATQRVLQAQRVVLDSDCDCARARMRVHVRASERVKVRVRRVPVRSCAGVRRRAWPNLRSSCVRASVCARVHARAQTSLQVVLAQQGRQADALGGLCNEPARRCRLPRVSSQQPSASRHVIQHTTRPQRPQPHPHPAPASAHTRA